jgi:hypothetical protein
MTTKDTLHQLIDDLPDVAIPEAARFLKNLCSHAAGELPRFLAQAPWDDEPETDEERAAVAEARDDLRNGRTVSMDEVKREFGL